MKTKSNSFRVAAFTLVELMVSIAILSVILILMTRILDATGRTWASTTGKVEQFRGARQGFEALTRRLSQATLNTYVDYEYANGPKTAPTRYVRTSELRFISGPASTLLPGDTHPTHAVFFQAPLGYVDSSKYANLKNLMNTWGYFLEYGSDIGWRPPFINELQQPPDEKMRFRLMELMEPSELMSVYQYTSGDADVPNRSMTYKGKEWFANSVSAPAETRPVRPLAENVIALVLLPKLTPAEDATGSALCPNYLYDSTATNADARFNPKNQLPPVVQVTMVAVDEKTYNRRFPKGTTMPDFGLPNYFANAGSVTDANLSGFAAELQSLQNELKNERLEWRVFTSNVSIRAAKWSRDQTN